MTPHPEPAGPVRAVTFDAAGTLIVTARPVGETYAAVAARHGASLDPEALGRGFRAAFAAAPPMAFSVSGEALDRAEREWWRGVVEAVVAPAGGVARFDPFFEDLYGHYAQAGAWRAAEGVRATLSALAAAGVATAVVSNFDSRLPGILRGAGIARWVRAVVFSTAAGSAKPDPAIFRHALDRLGVDAGRALHVGDSPRADGEGALAAGMRAAVIAADGRVALPLGVDRIGGVREVLRLVVAASG